MPDRALVVAIEQYGPSLGPLTNAGIYESARDFFGWLINVRSLAPENIFLCTDAPSSGAIPHIIAGQTNPKMYGATRSQIVQAIYDLLTAGSTTTPNFFLYAAGHGFEYIDSFLQPGTSMLIASDFNGLGLGGNFCINLDELQARLPALLSGQAHFYFIDACRNRINSTQIVPIALGIQFPDPGRGSATQFTLYSARSGQTAPADAAFSTALLGGLAGQGHAKAWKSGSMVVTFLGVWQRIVDVLGKPIDRRIQGGLDGPLYKLPPPVEQTCSIKVAGALPTDVFTAIFTSNGLSKSVDFTGPTCKYKLFPNDAGYQINVTQSGKQLVQTTPPPESLLDMYDDCSVTFEPQPVSFGLEAVRAPVIPPTGAEISFSIPHASSYHDPQWSVMRESSRGLQPMSVHSPNRVRPGNHTIHLMENGVSVWQQSIHILPGQSLISTVGQPPPSPFQQAVTAMLGQPESRAPELSELFGQTADWDTCLWLAILGTAIIRPIAGYYQRIQKVALPSAPRLAPGACGLMLLLVAEDGEPSFAIHQSAAVTWEALLPVPTVPTLYCAYGTLDPGEQLVSLDFPGKQPVTYTTQGVPDSFTLFTVSTADVLTVQQIFIPTPATVPTWSPADLTDLRLAKALSVAQRLHKLREPVLDQLFVPAKMWSALKAGTWINPQLLVFACFDLKRQGKLGDMSPLLDAAAVAGGQAPMAGDLHALMEAITPNLPSSQNRPLLLDSLLLDPEYATHTSLSPNHLNFGELWVSWYAAVDASQ